MVSYLYSIFILYKPLSLLNIVSLLCFEYFLVINKFPFNLICEKTDILKSNIQIIVWLRVMKTVLKENNKMLWKRLTNLNWTFKKCFLLEGIIEFETNRINLSSQEDSRDDISIGGGGGSICESPVTEKRWVSLGNTEGQYGWSPVSQERVWEEFIEQSETRNNY